jgi:hypothetical protein
MNLFFLNKNEFVFFGRNKNEFVFCQIKMNLFFSK